MWELSHWTFEEGNVQTKIININKTRGCLALTPRSGSVDSAGSLRHFGLAVARDSWLVCDERLARALVESLCNRALLAARNGEGPPNGDMRLRLFSLFIRFYRRHVRMAAIEDGASDAASYGPPGVAEARDGGSAVARAVRSLPLELRESLLLVVLERFSHVEAAQALDISLATLIDRLARGRAMLAAGLSERTAASPNHSQRRGAPNLRLVK
jgi:DNA-directed RNA polymerase specialized sigma24 family protein